MDAAILNYMNQQMAPMGGGVDQRRMTRAKDYLDTRRSIAGTRQIDANAERLELDNSQTVDTRAILEQYAGQLNTPQAMQALATINPKKMIELKDHFDGQDDRQIAETYRLMEEQIAQILASNAPHQQKLKAMAYLGKAKEVADYAQQQTTNELAADKFAEEKRKTGEAESLGRDKLAAQRERDVITKAGNKTSSENQRLAQVQHNDTIYAARKLLKQSGYGPDAEIDWKKARMNPELTKAQRDARKPFVIPMEFRDELANAAAAFNAGKEPKEIYKMLSGKGVSPYLLEQFMNE